MQYIEDILPWKAKKDKKRWCKGRIGRLHDYQPVDDQWRQRNQWIVDAAQGKGLASVWAQATLKERRVCIHCRKEKW